MAHSLMIFLFEYTALIEDGSVIPGNPDDSVFYQRLIETIPAKRMPLGQPPLAPAAIETIPPMDYGRRARLERNSQGQKPTSLRLIQCFRQLKTTSILSHHVTNCLHVILR